MFVNHLVEKAGTAQETTEKVSQRNAIIIGGKPTVPGTYKDYQMLRTKPVVRLKRSRDWRVILKNVRTGEDTGGIEKPRVVLIERRKLRESVASVGFEDDLSLPSRTIRRIERCAVPRHCCPLL